MILSCNFDKSTYFHINYQCLWWWWWNQ